MGSAMLAAMAAAPHFSLSTSRRWIKEGYGSWAKVHRAALGAAAPFTSSSSVLKFSQL